MKSMLMILVAIMLVVANGMFAGCTTQATVSGREISDVVLEQPRGAALYNGCFWKDRFWECDWSIKKSRRHTLKQTCVRLSPWQPLAAVCTLGIWVPMYIEWELNGDNP